MKKEIVKWWCNITDRKRFKIIEDAYEKDKNQALLNAMQKYPDAGILLTDTLEVANQKITSTSKIYQDQIRLPVSSSGSTTVKAPTTYSIKSGDTLFNIAQSRGITLESLIAVNPSVDPNNLQPGQIINLPTSSSTYKTSSTTSTSGSSGGLSFDDY